MNFIESTNIYLNDLNKNYIAMTLIVVILSLYASIFVNSIGNFTINLFSNDIFKFVIFVLIGFVASSNQTLGIILAICVLVTLQTIVYINIKKNIISEKFTTDQVEPYYLENSYLQNPLEMQNSLDPSLVNFNLNLENPRKIYNNMISKGKILLDDSIDMQKDLEKLNDVREKKIYDITKRDGEVLVQSGLNRLEVCNQGEYNFNGDNYSSGNNMNNSIKYVKFEKLIGDYLDHPIVISTYNQLQSNFEKLQTSIVNKDSFNYQLEVVYKNKIELLEQIYKLKKNSFDSDKINRIDSILKEINNFDYNKKNNYLEDKSENKIILHITELVELLS